jgi:hypothetical protein
MLLGCMAYPILDSWASSVRICCSTFTGVSEVTTTRGAGKPLNIRHQYEAQQTIAGFKLPVL